MVERLLRHHLVVDGPVVLTSNSSTVHATDTVDAYPLHYFMRPVMWPLGRHDDVTSGDGGGGGRRAVAVDGGDQTVEKWRRNDGRKRCSVGHLTVTNSANHYHK